MRDKKTPPKLSLIITVALVVLVGLTAGVWSRQMRQDKPTPAQSSTSQSAQKPAAKDDSVNYDGVDGKNALELLKAKATIVTKQSSYGEYVDSINGMQGGTDGKYWAFYVNGQMAQVGAADYQTKTGDKITWKFE